MAWQEKFIDTLKQILGSTSWYAGLAALGSFAYGDSDEFSDLDLVIVYQSKSFVPSEAACRVIAERCGHLIASYGGNHIGKPSLLVCLYVNPLRRVDLTFCDFAKYVDDQVQKPRIIDDPDDKLAAAADQIKGEYPPVDPQHIEDRFWVWIINCTQKVRRGDVFEAANYITSIRKNALLPLIHLDAGTIPRGYRALHNLAPDLERKLHSTHPSALNKTELFRSLRAMAAFYLTLRDRTASVRVSERSEARNEAERLLSQ